MKHFASLLAVALLVLPGCNKDSKKSGDGGTEDNGPPATALVEGLELTAVALYQGIKIPLMENGEEITSYPVPVVQDRNAMIRFYVERQSSWEPRDIYARVDFESSELTAIQEQFYVETDSVENDLQTTLNVDIPAEYLVGPVNIQVSLRELSGEDGSSGSGAAKWPSDGYASIDVDNGGGDLEVVLVPIRYNYDGSGRLPDTGDTQINLYKNLFHSLYPISDVNLILHDPIDWNSSLSGLGLGWTQLIEHLIDLRVQEGAPSRQYYYGIFMSAESFEQFCVFGCVLGMSNLAFNPGDYWARVSVGIGFPGSQSAYTMTHEVGHAHGREHAPCGLMGQPSDPNYPHANASIGAWGYDINHDVLRDPGTYVDMMSYCDPQWVSDYTYNALFDRVAAVNALPAIEPDPDFETHWLTLSIDLQDQVRLGPELDLLLPPEGEETAVQWLDADGNLLDEIAGVFRPFADLPGGFVLFPQPPPEVVMVRLPGHQAMIPL